MQVIFKPVLIALFTTAVTLFHTVPTALGQVGQPLSNFLEYENIRINSFDKFFNWFDETSSSLYVRDMQYSISQRGDSRFFSFNIQALPKAKQVDFMGTGITLDFKPLAGKNKSLSSVSALLQYKALAYFRDFNLQDVDPVDLKTLFQYGLDMFKLTPSEVAGIMINEFYSDRFKGSYEDKSETRARYALQPILDKMKEQFGITLKHYPSQSVFFSEYAKEIEQQTKQHYSATIFDLLIKGQNEEETLKNFSVFFGATGSSPLGLLDQLAPEGKFTINDNVVSLDFDTNIFHKTDKQGKKLATGGKVSLIPSYFTYKYVYGNNGWDLVLEFTEFGRREDYYFLFTNFVQLNPPTISNNYNPKKDMHHFVVEYDKIKQMKFSISKDRMIGDLVYNEGFSFYRFMDRSIP